MSDQGSLARIVGPRRPPIDPRRTAFFVCDMQNDFVHDDGAFPKRSGSNAASVLIPPFKKTLAACRESKIPIFFTRVVNRVDGVGQSLRMSREIGALMEGSWGAAVIDELKPLPAEFDIIKWRYSAFFATPLEMMLRGLNIQTIVLGGVATNGGVESNVRDAEYRDFNAVVLSDLCSARTKELHEASLETIRSSFGRVMTSGEFINILSK